MSCYVFSTDSFWCHTVCRTSCVIVTANDHHYPANILYTPGIRQLFFQRQICSSALVWECIQCLRRGHCGWRVNKAELAFIKNTLEIYINVIKPKRKFQIPFIIYISNLVANWAVSWCIATLWTSGRWGHGDSLLLALPTVLLVSCEYSCGGDKKSFRIDTQAQNIVVVAWQQRPNGGSVVSCSKYLKSWGWYAWLHEFHCFFAQSELTFWSCSFSSSALNKYGCILRFSMGVLLWSARILVPAILIAAVSLVNGYGTTCTHNFTY